MHYASHSHSHSPAPEGHPSGSQQGLRLIRVPLAVPQEDSTGFEECMRAIAALDRAARQGRPAAEAADRRVLEAVQSEKNDHMRLVAAPGTLPAAIAWVDFSTQARMEAPAADGAADLVVCHPHGCANTSLDDVGTAGPGSAAHHHPQPTAAAADPDRDPSQAFMASGAHLEPVRWRRRFAVSPTANHNTETEPQPTFPTVAQTSDPSVPLQPAPPAEDSVPPPASRAIPAMPAAEAHARDAAQARLQVPAVDEAAGTALPVESLYVAGHANNSLDGSATGSRPSAYRHPPTTTAKMPLSGWEVVLISPTVFLFSCNPVLGSATKAKPAQANDSAEHQHTPLETMVSWGVPSFAELFEVLCDNWLFCFYIAFPVYVRCFCRKIFETPRSAKEVFFNGMTVFWFCCSSVEDPTAEAANIPAVHQRTPLGTVTFRPCIGSLCAFAVFLCVHLAMRWMAAKVVVVETCTTMRTEPAKRCDKFGHPASFSEAIRGHAEFCKFLISIGADVNQNGCGCGTLLHLAAFYGFPDICILLLENGADANHKDDNGVTALHLAAMAGNIAICRILLRTGADVNHKDRDRATALEYATLDGHFELCDLLISRGADGTDKRFFDAVLTGDVKTCRKMLILGADANQCDKFGLSAFLLAGVLDNLEICKLLVRFGADVNKQDKNGGTPLHQAASRGRAELCLFILQSSADVHHQNKYGKTALHYAAEDGSMDICKMLLRFGADVNHRDRAGTSALKLATQKGHTEVCEMLIARGADAHRADDDGDTQLHSCTRTLHEVSTSLLQQSTDDAMNVVA